MKQKRPQQETPNLKFGVSSMSSTSRPCRIFSTILPKTRQGNYWLNVWESKPIQNSRDRNTFITTMPRKGSFSSSNSTSNENSTPITDPNQPIFLRSFMREMVCGLAIGLGIEVGKQLIYRVMGGNIGHQKVTQQQQNQNPCEMQNNNFVDCLKTNSKKSRAVRIISAN